jgi:hypothetical protein
MVNDHRLMLIFPMTPKLSRNKLLRCSLDFSKNVPEISPAFIQFSKNSSHGVYEFKEVSSLLRR